MKNKFITILILFFLSFENNLLSNEILFEAENVNISDNGNIVNTSNGTATSTKDNIKIKANKFIYNKSLLILDAIGDTKTTISEDNIIIKANKLQYNKKLFLLTAIGDVEIRDLTNKILAKSQNISYNTKERILKSKNNSSIEDNLGNVFLMDSFIFTLDDNLIKIVNAIVKDVDKNIIRVEKAFINVNSSKLIGKDISIDFNKKSFQNGNEPRLKGNTITSDGNESLITKGVFTTCKKNDDCPPWQLSAKEIKHDKNKKIIYYKDAWLKLYDKPVFYFPKFFHPDPSVKRQSGFLMPSFDNSSTLGSSLNIPYYFALADNKDLTLRPRLYGKKLLVQSEYRQVNEKSNSIFDFSVMNEKNLSASSHFFSTIVKELNFDNFDESQLNLQLQTTSNDTYLKKYKLESPIIEDLSFLSSSLAVNASREDLSFNAEVQVYENLSKKNSDRYEFIYPTYDLTKQMNNNTGLDGNISFNSSGYVKSYNTNISERVVLNNLLFKSDSKLTNKGFKNNYNFLIKNTNTDGSNSTKYTESRDHKFASLFEYNTSYPLKKEQGKYSKVLKPKMSFKFSPNNTRNLSNEGNRVDVKNVFSLERIGANDTIEGGASLTYGVDYSKQNESNTEILGAKIANVLRVKENKNLPNNSQLGAKTSNILGSFNINPSEVLKLNYDYGLKNNLTETSYQILGSKFKVNNFVTTFEYLNNNGALNNESYITNKTEYNINDSKGLIYETRKNKKTNLTEFHNLIYQYRNDCLIAAIEYNKDYYTDGDLRPEENLFIKLTIIPFGEQKSPSLK